MSKTVKALIIIIIVAITAVLCITVLSLSSSGKNDKALAEKDIYIMKTVDNTVGLYKGSELITIYDGIVIDTLPIEDRNLLEKGIEFESENEATLAAEDYDG